MTNSTKCAVWSKSSLSARREVSSHACKFARFIPVQISIVPNRKYPHSEVVIWRRFAGLLESLATHLAHSKDSGQTGRILRLIWVFAGRTAHFVSFVMLLLISSATARVTRNFLGLLNFNPRVAFNERPQHKTNLDEYIKQISSGFMSYILSHLQILRTQTRQPVLEFCDTNRIYGLF